MSPTTIGLFVGLLLALIVAVAGWGWFFLALLFGLVGVLIGAHIEGRVDLTTILPGRDRG